MLWERDREGIRICRRLVLVVVGLWGVWNDVGGWDWFDLLGGMMMMMRMPGGDDDDDDSVNGS